MYMTRIVHDNIWI